MNAQELLRRLVLEEIGLKDAPNLRLAEAIQVDRDLGALEDAELAREICACPNLRRELASTLSVGESFFFRHPEHSDPILALAAQRLATGGSFVVWSAGCSRGEEPYTVALQLLDRFGTGCRHQISILGTDIHGESLSSARLGRYGRWSLRATPVDVIRRRFLLEGDVYQLVPDVIGWPEFHHLSIQEHLTRMAPASIDVVLFRNVGIYLTDEALAAIHAGFARVLKPGGLLLQSVTDPTPPASPFVPDPDGTIGAYRHGAGIAPSHAAVARRAFRPSLPPPLPSRDRAPRHPPQARQVAPALDGGGRDDLLASASRLADLGRDREALDLIAALLRADTTARDAYILRARIFLELGRAAAAADDLRAALLLDPADPLTRYWYVLALEAAGRDTDAARQRSTVASQLETWPPERLLHDGTTSPAALRALIMRPERDHD